MIYTREGGHYLSLPERQFLLAGLAWAGLLVVLAVHLTSTVVPPALAACRQACSNQPFLIGLLHALPHAGSILLSLAVLAALVWVGFSTARQVLLSRRALRGLRRLARPLPKIMRRVAASVGVGEAVLYIHDPRPLAFCCGLWRPRIVVSSGLVSLLTTQELKAVLQHERQHLIRRDPLRLTLLRAAAGAMFYVPLADDLRRRCEVSIELAADQAALASNSLRGLAGALLKSTRYGRMEVAGASAGAFDATGARIATLAGRAPQLPRLSGRRLAFSVLLAVGLLLGTAAVTMATGPAGVASCCAGSTYCTVPH